MGLSFNAQIEKELEDGLNDIESNKFTVCGYLRNDNTYFHGTAVSIDLSIRL